MGRATKRVLDVNGMGRMIDENGPGMVYRYFN